MVTDDDYVIHGPPPLEPVPKISLGRYIYDNLLSNQSTNDALFDPLTDERISYKQLFERSVILATALSRCGYGEYTTMAICSENNVHFYTPLIAAFYTGATVATINFAYTSYELDHNIKISKPSVIFCSKLVANKFTALRESLPYLQHVILMDSKESIYGADCIEDFVSGIMRGCPVPRIFQPVDVDVDNHVAFILCSSGTTGLPKGVMLTDINIHTRMKQAVDERYHRIENDVVLGILPFFHAFGLITCLGAIMNKQKIIILKKFEEKLFLSTIEKYRISMLWLAPPLAVFLAKSPLVSKYDLTSIKEITCGAAPLSKDTENLLKKRLNVKAIRQGYGQTEGTLALTFMMIDDFKQGSVGKVITYMKCKVRDPTTGKGLGPNQVGELCFKGPLVMKGYCQNPEATRETFTNDGWLRTGDLGYYDEAFYFYIVDRLKELIKYKGFQVAPAELEALILTHPEVKDVGVVGLQDEVAGELPLAYVVKLPGSSLSERQIQDYVASKVSHQKWLRGGVIFVDSIPKNQSGKILRRELRRYLQKYKSKL